MCINTSNRFNYFSMKLNKTKSFVVITAIIFASIYSSLYASTVSQSSQQSIETATSTNVSSSTNQFSSNEVNDPHSVNCFDYYSFGSVPAVIQSATPQVVSGIPIRFTITLTNKNQYPIVDGNVYIKVYRNQDTHNNNGPYLVDEFYMPDTINLKAGEVKTLPLTWNVPQYAYTGTYKIVTYVIASKKFNLLGLNFMDDIVGNTYEFKVQGETKGVQFDKNKVTLNDNQYTFAAFPPHFSETDPITLSVPIENTTGSLVMPTITWNVYRWASSNSEDLIETKTNTYTVLPGNNFKATYTLTDTRYPVYYIVAKLTYNNSSSIIGVRFVRDGIDRIRLNFPAVTTYPLEANKEATVFSCLHSTGGYLPVQNGKLVLSVKDKHGDEIHTYTYNGIVTGQMMALKDTFIPKQDIDIFTVNAKLYMGDVLMDSATMHYDCKALAVPCHTSYTLWFVLGGGVLVLLVILLVLRRKK